MFSINEPTESRIRGFCTSGHGEITLFPLFISELFLFVCAFHKVLGMKLFGTSTRIGGRKSSIFRLPPFFSSAEWCPTESNYHRWKLILRRRKCTHTMELTIPKRNRKEKKWKWKNFSYLFFFFREWRSRQPRFRITCSITQWKYVEFVYFPIFSCVTTFRQHKQISEEEKQKKKSDIHSQALQFLYVCCWWFKFPARRKMFLALCPQFCNFVPQIITLSRTAFMPRHITGTNAWVTRDQLNNWNCIWLARRRRSQCFVICRKLRLDIFAATRRRFEFSCSRELWCQFVYRNSKKVGAIQRRRLVKFN